MNKRLTTFAALSLALTPAAAGCSPNPQWDRETMTAVECVDGVTRYPDDVYSGVENAADTHGLKFDTDTARYVSDQLHNRLGSRALSAGVRISVGLASDGQPLTAYVGACAQTMPGYPTTAPSQG